MTFNDILKSDFLNNITSVSIFDMCLCIIMSFGLGVFIFYVYKKTYRGVMYSQSFGTALIALTMITSIVILAVTSNVVLSLGMVGALSIVRFRAAIKEPLDIVFLFWAVGSGIIIASGMIVLAVLGSVIIGIIMVVFVNRKAHSYPYMVVLHCENAESEKNAKAFLDENVLTSVVKSKSASYGNTEMNIEVRLKDDNTDFINELAKINGVKSAVMVSYNGDYMG